MSDTRKGSGNVWLKILKGPHNFQSAYQLSNISQILFDENQMCCYNHLIFLNKLQQQIQ